MWNVLRASHIRRPAPICRHIRQELRRFASAADVRQDDASAKDDIVDMLTESMQKEQEAPDKNVFKIRAFANAIKAIKQLDHPVRSVDDVKGVHGIGVGIARRINEFFARRLGDSNVSSSQLTISSSTSPSVNKSIDEAKMKRRAVAALQEVPSIGPKAARDLVEAGCMTLADLHKPEYLERLKPAMRVGVKFAKHLQTPVGRSEAEAVATLIQETISPEFDLHLVGSYRRGAPQSNDIDILLFHPSFDTLPTPPPSPSPFSPTTSTNTPKRGRPSIPFSFTSVSLSEREKSILLDEVVKPLEKCGVIAGKLSSGTKKFQGVARVPKRKRTGEWETAEERLEAASKNLGAYRRLDLNLAPLQSKASALLSLTGDLDFNRDMRSRAAKMGMHLNEFGLWRWVPSGDSTGASEATEVANASASSSKTKLSSKGEEDADACGIWEHVPTDSEASLLTELGVEWIEPEKRNFGFLSDKPKASRGRGRPRKV
ncbi:hypothetical protein JAAARDRAFT_203697 [Jaapia argillacea MUCL 33604]|uniref:DNA-directed DNA polymerase X domain-containing protein n=1 Tax=Jaapia argillacea MUCL 33604 TaxID=933084 RepID=A0A067QJ04_9AGAM|nr:hypothetical protein JAAARDRAFT_203697 [Jaapia argillacea MUCL 33604]